MWDQTLGFLGWLFTLMTANPEMLIGALAFLVALWNGRMQQQHAGLSVIPAFSVWAFYPTGSNRTCLVKISNNGFGPAIIDRMEVFFDGERIKGYMYEKIHKAIECAFGDQLVDVQHAFTEEKGHAFGANNERVLAKFEVAETLVKQKAEGIGSRMEPLVLSITYRDIYGRKWYFLVHEFVGITWRRNSPAHLINWFRYRSYL